MLGFTRSTLLIPLFSLPFLLQPIARAQSQAQGRPKIYACPKDNGARYTAPNGITFELKCNQGTTAKRIDNNNAITSQKSCADQCSEHPNCQSADWSASPLNCARFSEYIPTIPMEGVNTWFPIEKRKDPEKTYTCPGDDGAQYTTPNGVTFQLKCGQGTTAKPIDNVPKGSQKECADWCSEHPNCQSADFNAPTGNCVRFGEYIPTVPNPAINTWFPLEERKSHPEKEERTPPDCPKRKPVLAENTSEGFVPAGSEAQCPENNGKIFVTSGGTYYQIKCNTQSTTAVEITKRPLHDLAECMTACGDIPGCKSVTFSAGKPSWDCKFFGTGVAASAADPNNKMTFAYAIEPPTSAKSDDEILLCATECPMADGQTWEAPNGVTYHMDCCKRHGITIIDSDTLPSLTACMKACSMINGCTSVDWHQETQMCYWGKHSGEPTVAVAGWSSAHSLGCAGACKKMSGGGGCNCGSKSEL